MWWRDFQKGAVIGDFKQRAGILHRSEFDRFRLDWYKSLESSLLKEHNIVVIEEEERTSNVISHWDEQHPIYYIPIYRCEGIKTNDSWSICIEKLLELGFLPLEIAERLGHEKIETTLNTYSHLYPNKQQRLADRLEKEYKEELA